VRSRPLAGVALLAIASTVTADEPTAPAPSPAQASQPDGQPRPSEGSIAERFAQLRAESEAQRAAYQRDAPRMEIPRNAREAAERMTPETVAYVRRMEDLDRRMLDLIASSPADPAARDALLWMLGRPGRSDTGTSADRFAVASALLVRHHGDDPEAVRIGLDLAGFPSHHRAALLLGFYAAAKGREAKGLARMALAQYLERKSAHVAYARANRDRPSRRLVRASKVVAEVEMSDEQYAYHLELGQCDPDALHAEAVRLYGEVIAEYGDVPYVTRSDREMEALLKQPEPRLDGRPLTELARRRFEERLARKRTLGQEAEARLDEIESLAVGKAAPEIVGVDLDGVSRKLSDYRGKVVVLVFWGSWCGVCMAEVPHEREMAERLKGRPFAVLGVDCADDRDTARKVVERERMTWPSWYDGAAGPGPIASRYHIRGFPSFFVLDARGVIRSKGGGSVGVDELVDKLLDEAERAAKE
jgi:thiol-disulfide isomerase/thioredoxin